MSTQNHYHILGIEQTATPSEIKSAWKTLIQVWHPDRFQGPLHDKAEAMTKKINAAYHELRDPQKRAAYDKTLAQQSRKVTPPAQEPAPRSYQPFEHIFNTTQPYKPPGREKARQTSSYSHSAPHNHTHTQSPPHIPYPQHPGGKKNRSASRPQKKPGAIGSIRYYFQLMRMATKAVAKIVLALIIILCIWLAFSIIMLVFDGARDIFQGEKAPNAPATPSKKLAKL